jgi:hypothetical protein
LTLQVSKLSSNPHIKAWRRIAFLFGGKPAMERALVLSDAREQICKRA